MMTRKTPKTLTPKLRFPKFRDARGWKEKGLGSQGDFLSSLSGKTGKDFDTGDAKFITYMNVFSNTFTDKNDLRSVDVVAGETQNAVSKGDVFFTVSSETPEETGMSSVLLEDIDNCYLNSFCTLFRFDEGKLPEPVFLGYMLRSAIPREHLAKSAQGSTRFNLSKGTFRDVPLLLPEPDEQQKIADCLGSLDDWLAAAGRKLAALRDHKRGLMQQLFPQPNQSQPQQRFPEFRGKPKWASKCLADFDPFVTSGSRGWASYYADSGDLFVRITNLTRESIYLDLSKCKYVRLPSAASEGKRTQLKTHDLLVSVTADIGIIGYVSEDVPSPAYINQHIALVRFDKDSVCSKFVAYYLASETSQRLFRSSTDNGTKAGMNLTGVQNMKVMIPGIDEQQKIAACLTALDTQITAQADQIESLKQHKRGLMQQLFPSPEDN